MLLRLLHHRLCFSLLHHVVGAVKPSVDVTALIAVRLVLHGLRLAGDVRLHLAAEVFHDGLTLADIAATSHCGTLLDRVVPEHLVISFSLKLLSLRAHLLLLCDDS